MQSQSPCARKPECLKKDKRECSYSCLDLHAYQRFLAKTYDKYSPPGIDYADHDRMNVRSGILDSLEKADSFS